MAEERMLNDEILIGLIKANSGGGGTTNYNDLSNQPQINSVTLSGDKSASDLGLATANSVSGILDGQTIDSFADVETALAGKQNALTAGDYINISAQNEIEVSRSIAKTQVHKYNMFFHNGRYCTVTKYIDNEQVGSAITYDYLSMSPNPAEIDDVMTLKANGDTGNWLVTNIVASHDHAAGYVETKYRGGNDNTYVQEFDVVVDADKKLIIQSELDDAMAGKQNVLTFDTVPTDGSNNPVKSNGIYDALATKANTDMVAADFNAGTSYTAGNYCIYGGKFYKFNKNHSGAWAAADVDEIKIAGELSSLNSKITTVDDGVITPETGVSLTSYALKKSINTVSISALVQLTPTLGTNNTIGVMPSSFKPSADRVYITCVNATSDKLVIGYVDKYGGIYIYPTSNDSSAVAQNYYISGAFVVG